MILVDGFSPYPKNDGVSSSVGVMKIPTEWKIFQHVPDHQAVLVKLYSMDWFKGKFTGNHRFSH
jgi:hypothetical protein